MDPDALKAYSERLSAENLEDVLMALEKLAELARGEYESVMPDVGGILAVVGVMAVARQNRISGANRTTLVRFQCPECHYLCSGFVTPQDHDERRCQGFPKERKTDDDREICGALMVEIYREDGFKTGKAGRA